MSTQEQTPKAKPLKRPTQARAKVTVQAIYDAFVRIWQRDGWERLTTRAVALETGIAVGTLYDYFPNKAALMSGYVRHCIEALIQAVDEQAVKPPTLDWEERLRRLVRLACGVKVPELPWTHRDMMSVESDIASPKHQTRAHEELYAMWRRVFEACTDLPRAVPNDTALSLHLSVWGGRRYAALVRLDVAQLESWAMEMERICLDTVRLRAFGPG